MVGGAARGGQNGLGNMPKKKTNKSTAKRFKRTASGKYKFDRAGGGHLLSTKSRKRKRSLRRGAMVSKAEVRRINTMLLS